VSSRLIDLRHPNAGGLLISNDIFISLVDVSTATVTTPKMRKIT
jgi:hypothetical protein